MRNHVFLSIFLGLFTLSVAPGGHAENRYPDKRLSRSMELYRLETGLDSPEVKAQLAAKDEERAKALANLDAERARELKAKDDELNAAHQRLAQALIPGGGVTGPNIASSLRNDLSGSSVVAGQGDSAVSGSAMLPFQIKKGSIVEALTTILAQPLPDGSPGYQLVWRAPHYPVIEDFEVYAPDSLGVLDQVIGAYQREGVGLEAIVYSGNNVIEVGLGGFRQRMQTTATSPAPR